MIVELSEDEELKLDKYINDIYELLNKEEVPAILNKPKCKKCAYYEYCYI